MNRKNSSGSGLFLMEMMVVVGFFILCAATCILAYVKADSMSRLAADRNQAVSAAQSLVEVWKLSGEEGLEDFMERKDGEQMCIVYWDEDWNVIGSTEPAAYYACMLIEPEQDGLSTARVSVYRIGSAGVKDNYEDYEAEKLFSSEAKELFSLEAKKYRRMEGADGRL